ncbi:MAG: MerR family transcriptional regulator [Sphaerochaeta sp.]|nr:MerR family transcriptional regulator [Sphaerochaeta sp.]
MRDFFSIGEFSELFGVDVQTLRYYDSIGLLVPAHRDAVTGYRKYKFDQVYHFASIRYFKRLGYSLKQIHLFLASRSLDHTMGQLRTQSEQLKQRWNDLMNIDSAIQRKLEFIEKQLPLVDFQGVTRKTFAKRYFLDIGVEESLYGSDVFYFYPTLVFYHGVKKRFGAYLFNHEKPDGPIGEVLAIQAGDFLCGYHHGSYESIDETFLRIRKDAKGIDLADYSINFNVVDQFVEHDNSRFITEVQIPILD